jgi:hypothetical protein
MQSSTKNKPTSPHIVIDHSQIPGLEKHKANKTSHNTNETQEEIYIDHDKLPPVLQVSPRFGENYHRGTMNRPIHPAMRSNIVFNGSASSEIGHHFMNPKNNDTTTRHDDSSNNKIVKKNVEKIKTQQSPNQTNFLNLDERRLKELAYREELRLQIEENKRRKEEEQIRKERELKQEEERIQRDREKLAMDFVREKERQRRKEIEASKRAALLQQSIQIAHEHALADKEKTKRSNIGRREPHQETSPGDNVNHQRRHDDIPVVPLDTNICSPVMPKALVHKNHRHNNALLEVKKDSTSQVSLYSSSSEEPIARAVKQKPTNSGKIAGNGSRSVKETRGIKRFSVRKHILNAHQNRSDSESENHFARQPRGGHKPSALTGSHKPMANSIARTTKQALTKSQKEHSHNRTVRLKDHNPPSSPDYNVRCRNGGPTISPPIPTIAKRLAQQYAQSNPEINNIANVRQSTPQDEDNSSPIDPNQTTVITNNHGIPPTGIPTLPHISMHHPSMLNISEIERAPTCSPTNEPINDATLEQPIKLPPILELKSRDDERRKDSKKFNENELGHEKMLDHLFKLKQSIVSHTHNMDSKVKNLLLKES